MRRLGRWMAGFAAVGLVCAGILGVGAVLVPPVDLRPPEIAAGIDAASAAEGRARIEALATAHGGLERWRSLGVTEVSFRDVWPSDFVRAYMSPFEKGETYVLTHRNGTDDIQLAFVGGPRAGTTWGMQQWVTYTVDAGGQRVFVDDADLKFWLPTVTYFFEMPFRLREADVVAAVGERTLTGEDAGTYDLVFASWGKAEPQAGVDQYVAWIGRDDGLLHFVSYTVRDAAKFVQGCARFRDFRTIDGIVVPTDTTYGACPGDADPMVIHHQTVEAVAFRPERAAALVPDPTRTGRK